MGGSWANFSAPSSGWRSAPVGPMASRTGLSGALSRRASTRRSNSGSVISGAWSTQYFRLWYRTASSSSSTERLFHLEEIVAASEDMAGSKKAVGFHQAEQFIEVPYASAVRC